jgi:DNA-binding NarL/FixJ family response regulator
MQAGQRPDYWAVWFSQVHSLMYQQSKECCVKKGKVLLADIHQNMLAGVRTVLENMFEKVFMVADEASLLDAAEKIKPDLIIADLSLPVTMEINIARRLYKTFPEIKLIILSIHDESSAINECMEAGAKGFVLKRTAVNDLVPAVKAVLQDDSYVSPAALMKSDNRPVYEKNPDN